MASTAYAKIVMIMSSDARKKGTTTEAWWLPASDTPTGVDALYTAVQQIAVARAQLLGQKGKLNAVRISLYDANFGRNAVLPPFTNHGTPITPTWNPGSNQPDVDAIQNLTLVAGRTNACPVRLNFNDNTRSYAKLGLPPQGAAMEQVSSGGQEQWNNQWKQGPQAKFESLFFTYISILIGAGARKRIRAPYTPKIPIIGGNSGTPSTLGTIIVASNPSGVLQPGLTYHIGGRRPGPGRSARGVREFSGDRSVASVSAPDSVTGAVTLGIVCTINVGFDPCRKPGYIAPIQYTMHTLKSAVVGQYYDAHRNAHASSISLPPV